jgi:hypothetical protein
MGRGARAAETIEGLVCSVRTIKTGRLVAKTRGDLSAYVLEIIHSETFERHVGTSRNSSGVLGPARLKQSPVWRRAQEILREAASKKQLLSAASGGLSDEPYKSLLGGWRVVKVKAEVVEAVD